MLLWLLDPLVAKSRSMDGGADDTSGEGPAPADEALSREPYHRADGSGHVLEGCQALARAISSTLSLVMREFDSRAETAFKSQDELSLSLDQLTAELDKLLEDAPVPLIMQHALSISSIRRRIAALNLLLKSIQQRIDNIDYMLSSGLSQESTPNEQDIPTISALTL